MRSRSTLTAIALAGAGASAANNATYPANATVPGASPVTNTTAFTTSLNLSLEDLWNMWVGPIETANITTTVAATPIPSSSLVPPPFLNYPSFPPGRQVPMTKKNESWSFPKDFWFGVASAAVQVEGAAKAEGKGPSLWDYAPHRVPGTVVGNGTADVADNHYYLYKQDIARLAAMGISHYSFSISWPRILPFGSGQVNEQGIAHYNDVINTCLQYNMTPMVTLYHWDIPLFLQNTYGGWYSEQIITDFTEYARIAYSRFGDRVKSWVTINEPTGACGPVYTITEGYYRDVDIPANQRTAVCLRNLLLSHTEAYRLGKQMMPDSLITFKNNGGYKIPATNSSADAAAVQAGWDTAEGWWADPIFLTGDFPQHIRAFTDSFLTPFTEEQKARILGSADYFAWDGYTSTVYKALTGPFADCNTNPSNPYYPYCFTSSSVYPDGWQIGPLSDPGASWLAKATDWVPQAMREIQDRWHPEGGILVSEFGFAEPFEALKTDLPSILYDPIRSAYFRDYMEGLLMSLSEGINVLGTLAWSLVDNLEWNAGYGVRFGIQHVNYTTLERSYKASFFEYASVYNTYVEK